MGSSSSGAEEVVGNSSAGIEKGTGADSLFSRFPRRSWDSRSRRPLRRFAFGAVSSGGSGSSAGSFCMGMESP